ncbi:MAG: FMN-binding protein [Brevinematales bacterium]|nr:FMN-binding protein [Brevinematales bacterium]
MDFLKKLYPLVVIATVLGGLLALTYGGLKPLLEAADEREFERALKDVYASFSRYEVKTFEDKTYYVLYENEAVVAYVFRASFSGYGGPVETLTAVTNGAVARVVVMSMPGETPGLGTKARDPKWIAQFLGRGYGDIPLTKDDFKAKGCDAVSGATFSSVAVTRGIHEALVMYKKIQGDTSLGETTTSATPTSEK